MSKNGWTDDFLCTQWFWETFIPQASAKNISGSPILLIYDGHGSHTTDKMRKLAEEHNIELFCLPPHTTHWTQPLDVGMFGPLQCRWQEHCDEVLETTDEEIWKVDFVKEYMAAREKAFLPETIEKAWKKSGIYQHNPNIFTDADFAPSTSTSRHAHVPGSYPTGHDSDDSDFESGLDIPSDSDDESDGTPSEHSDDEEEGDRWEGFRNRPEIHEEPSPLATHENQPPNINNQPSSVDDLPSRTQDIFDAGSTASVPSQSFFQTHLFTSSITQSTGPTHPQTASHRRSQSDPFPIQSHNQAPSPMLISRAVSTPYRPRKSHDVEEENQRLREENERLKVKLEASKMHAKLARLEMEDAQQRLNAK